MHFWQRDSKWGDMRLGFGGTTLAQEGCLVCSVADIIADTIDQDVTPAKLNRWLARNDGFIGGNRFVFDSVSKYDSGLNLLQIIDCNSISADILALQKHIGAGGYAVVKVDMNPWSASVNQHWVRVLEVDEQDCIINDPWIENGATVSLLERYARHDWDSSSRAIFRIVYYTI